MFNRRKITVDRRTALKLLSLGALSAAGGHLSWRLVDRRLADRHLDLSDLPLAEGYPWEELPPAATGGGTVNLAPMDPLSDEGSLMLDPTLAEAEAGVEEPSYLDKIRDFDRAYSDDVILDADRLELLTHVARHLGKAQRVIGHGHFNLLGFDNLLRYGRRYSKIGRFSRQELDFLEEIFAADATDYGFYGDKVMAELTAVIPESDTVKIANTGHYLFRGEPHEKYEKMCSDLGGSIFLTSGIRAVIKQMHLFIDKAVVTEGNLSQASRSLAPPGYSYHAVGDFDIGKVGFGLDNFTDTFATTDEYKRLVDLGYAELRYTPTNPFGGRHEPWHIKMA